MGAIRDIGKVSRYYLLDKWVQRVDRLQHTGGAKATALSGPTTGTWASLKSKKNHRAFVEESYLRNVVAYRCAKEVAMALGQAEWGLWKWVPSDQPGTFWTREPIEQDPVLSVIEQPNPQDSFGFLLLKWAIFLQLNGNAYLRRIAPTSGPNMGIPQELEVLRPDRMEVATKDGRITGYKYTVDGRSTTFPVDPLTGQSEIMHSRLFNPIDDVYGASIVESAAYEIDSHNDATEWNMNLIRNQGRPGMILTIISDANIQVGDEQIQEMKRDLAASHEGPKNTGRNMILTGGRGTGAAPYGYSPTELDWDKGRLALARDICMAFGVPPMLIGIPGEATFANYKEARESFWEDTAVWYLDAFKGDFNSWQFPRPSFLRRATGRGGPRVVEEKFLDYSIDDIPAMAGKRDKLWDRATKSGDFLTIDERREIVGFPPYEPGTDPGQVILAQASLVPLDEGFRADENDETLPPDEDEEKPVPPVSDEDDDDEEEEDDEE